MNRFLKITLRRILENVAEGKYEQCHQAICL